MRRAQLRHPLALFTTLTAICSSAGIAAAALPKADDFDGDGKADIAVFEPQNGTWTIRRSGNGSTLTQGWGWNEVTPVPGDYDGDGKTDIAVYHQATGTWYILQSSTGTQRVQGWGWSDAMAVPGDYDGDGKTDIAVYHQAAGNWYILQSGTNTQRVQNWGWSAAVPAPADYDGDQKVDLTVYHPAAGQWYILRSSNNTQKLVSWGWSESAPVPADYDGDGKADVAVFHQLASKWYILPSNGSPSVQPVVGSGQPVAAPGDHDGDGKADIAAYQRRTGQWTVQLSGNGSSWLPVFGNRDRMSVGLGYQVFRQKMARVPSRVVVFGDSVAAGAGATGSAAFTGCTNSGPTQPVQSRSWSAQLAQNDDAAWPERAGLDLRTKAFSSIAGNCVTYHNFAVGGATTGSVISQQLSATSPAKQQFPTPPAGITLAVLDIGGNDLLASQGSGATWYAPAVGAATVNLATIATKIRQIFGASTVIHVAGVYDPSDGWLVPPAVIPFDPAGVKGSFTGWQQWRIASEVFVPGVAFSGAAASLNSSYSAVAGQIGVSVVDIRTPFLGHGHWWSNAQQSGAGWFWDHVHPNDAGHSALRDVFWEAIDDAFSTL